MFFRASFLMQNFNTGPQWNNVMIRQTRVTAKRNRDDPIQPFQTDPFQPHTQDKPSPWAVLQTGFLLQPHYQDHLGQDRRCNHRLCICIFPPYRPPSLLAPFRWARQNDHILSRPCAFRITGSTSHTQLFRSHGRHAIPLLSQYCLPLG